VTTIYATDLDRTLIFSARAVRQGEGTPGEAEDPPVPGYDLVPVERHDDRDISFMSRRQLDLLRAVERHCLVVPVSTRAHDQYRRVSVWPGPRPWAVVANGGILLEGGVPDADWTAAMKASVADRCLPLPAVADWLAATAARWIDHVRVADDLFLSALVDRAALPAVATIELAGQLARWGWELSIQGRKLYAVPVPVRKSTAVREVARRAGATRVIAAGDSLLDRDLLDDADLGLRPAHGELHEIGAPADVVTAAAGVVAGEELLAAVLGEVRDDGPAEPGGRVPAATPPPAARARPA
jgi:hypothetical protein